MSIDTAAGGGLMRKSIEAVKTLLEEMTSNTYQRSSEIPSLKRSDGKYGVDCLDLLASNVDALAHQSD